MKDPREAHPPVETSDVQTVRPHASSLGPQANVVAGLCYVPPVGLAVYALEKTSVFVRFHALQSMLVHAFLLVASVLLVFVVFTGATVADAFGSMRWTVVGLLGVAIAGALGYCIARAAKWEVCQLPVVGEHCYARTLARLPGK